MLLEADWVLPVSGPPIEDGAIRVDGGVIQAVGPAAELRAGQPREQGEVFRGCVLLPGFVNAHTHLEYSAFGGFAPPSGFGQWMLRLLFARRKLTADDYMASALWGAHECVRCGVTAIADASYEGWTVARAAGAAGLRARVYLELFGLDDAALPAAMDRLESGLDGLRAECRAAGRGALLEPGLSPHAPYTVSSRLYREAGRFARRAGLRLTTHVAESQAEVELLVEGTGSIAHAYRAARLWTGHHWSTPGLRPVPYLAASSALGPEMLAVHAVHIDADDIATLAASGSAVAHCPRSNSRLRCGAAPVAELLAAGVTVGLGTDSLGSNDSLDMFAEMRAALETAQARAATGAPGQVGRALDAGVVLRMATLEGARALGWDHLVGSLEPGKRADLIAVCVPEGTAGDPVAALVEVATASDVRLTMVDGVPISRGTPVEDGIAEGLRSARAKLGLQG